jgi:hypothetical protein
VRSMAERSCLLKQELQNRRIRLELGVGLGRIHIDTHTHTPQVLRCFCAENMKTGRTLLGFLVRGLERRMQGSGLFESFHFIAG